MHLDQHPKLSVQSREGGRQGSTARIKTSAFVFIASRFGGLRFRGNPIP